MSRYYPQEELTNYFKFFEGNKCVVTNKRATRHEVDGKNQNRTFENLLYLDLELHNGLIPRERGGVSRRNLAGRSEMDPANLSRTAADHFEHGHSHRAYACMRLAYSLHRYYFRDRDRSKNDELTFFAKALYFLRRPINDHPELAHRLLWHHLLKELPETISIPGRASKGTALIVEEFASWLNEQGYWHIARPLFEKLNVIVPNLSHDTNEDARKYKARFYRQFAHNMMAAGDVARFQALLSKAAAANPTNGCSLPTHNEIALFTTRAPFVFLQGIDSATMKEASRLWELVEPLTSEGFDAVSHAEQTKVSIATMRGSFVYVAMIFAKRYPNKARLLLDGLKEPKQQKMEFVNNPIVGKAFAKLKNLLPEAKVSSYARLMRKLPPGHANELQRLAIRLLN